MNNPMKIIDSAVLAGTVLFVGAAASWYLAIPLALAGIYFIFLRNRSAFRPGSQQLTQVVDDLDDPDGRISIANSYHRLLRRD